jgi:molecular chaperone HtpG
MAAMQAELPQRLHDVLEESSAAGTILGFSRSCSEILADNEMPFFPAYTDHGTSHVEAVLEAAERLIPAAVWEEGLLGGDDVAVLVAAAFLHDLALHLREPGFLALVGTKSRYKPVPWFDEDQRGRPADAPWPDLWQDFCRQARRFSQSQLDRILGPGHEEAPAIVFGDLDAEPSEWTLNDRLLIGEFLRQHHARLAHEIAIYGFPGIGGREFPVLHESTPRLAEAIGAAARSHNEEMRIVAEYLDSRGRGDLRPDGVAQLYLMGILRIADYFQLHPSRATPLLLHLREPQSPASVAEWQKHQAISSISWDHKDPHAVKVQVSPAHDLRIHLQLGELLADLQRELDSTAAVLSETYGGSKLSGLRLELQRVRTNLHEPELHARLPFVPEPSHLRSAEDLFRLMVGDLYGNEPVIAGRELLQNAVDAVRERRRWEAVRASPIADDRFRSLPADVLVEIEEKEGGEGVLRVVDRGIGMTPATVRESFLTAGATFAPAGEDSASAEGRIEWMKAGRFGIGVFAAFLLGSEIQVTTRQLNAERGVRFTARLDDDLIQLDWEDDAPLGTEIVVPYSVGKIKPPRFLRGRENLEELHFSLLSGISSFFRLAQPRVEFVLRRLDGPLYRVDHKGEIPDPEKKRLPDQWRKVRSSQFDAVLWSLPNRDLEFTVFAPWNGYGTKLAHNGFLVSKPQSSVDHSAYEWANSTAEKIVGTPSVAVFDTKQQLKIALNRYELAEPTIPFERELLQSIGKDVVAHALAQGEEPYPLDTPWGLKPVVSRTHWVPLIPRLVDRYVRGDLCVLLVSEPARRKMASRFLKGRTAGGRWRELPFRTVVAPDDAFVDELDHEWVEMDESLSKSHAEKEALYSFDESISLGRFPFVGVLARRQGKITPLYHWEEDEEYRDADRLGELLVTLAEELREIEEPEFFALVVMREYDSDWHSRDEPIAAPWEQTVGGLLERGVKARQQRCEAITARDRSMGALVNKWRRFASLPLQPEW